MNKEAVTTQMPLIPGMRFEGFSGEWRNNKLGDISTSYSGGTPSVGMKKYYGGNIPFIRSAEINSSTTKLSISELGLNSSSAKMVEKGSVLYAMYGATSGEVGVSKIKGAINQAILAIEPNSGYDSHYVMQWLRKQKKYITDTYLQGGQGNLSGNIVKDLSIRFPALNEQIEIGNILTDLDTLIIARNKELTKLTQLKQAMLQKLFPKDGEKVPEVRFEGFEGEWKARTLGEVGYTYTGLSGKTKEDFGHGHARYVPYTNVFNNTITKADYLEKVEIDNQQNTVRYGDVFFTTSSETPEEVGMASVWLNEDSNVYLNSFCFGYRTTTDIDYSYFAFLLRSPAVRTQFKLLAQGISRYNISKTKAMDITLGIPTLSEQKQIGCYFKTLDKNIQAKQAELKKLKQFKQAMLDKLFV